MYLTLCLLVIAWELDHHSVTAKQPHILFIAADDLGYNDVSWTNPSIKTPRMDKLAKEGVILNRNYVYPLCTPSRVAFMTGRYPHKLGLQHKTMTGAQPNYIPLKYDLMPKKLKEQGYHTHMVGKWHLGHCDEKVTPTERGFDSFFGFYTGAEDYYDKTIGEIGLNIRTHASPKVGQDYVSGGVTSFVGMSHPSQTFYRNLMQLGGKSWNGLTVYDFRMNKIPYHPGNHHYSEYATESYAERAIEIIEAHNIVSPDEPMFMYLAMQAPHNPLEVPQEYIDQIDASVTDSTRRVYEAMVLAMDTAIGNVTDALESAGMLDDTVIVFTSDNGGQPNQGANNLPYRGTKGGYWEGGIRAPAFIYGKMLGKTGYENDKIVHATDWYATFLNLAGGDAATEGIDGIDQFDPLFNDGPAARTMFPIQIDNSAGVNFKGIIKDNFKLMLGDPGSNNQLYPLPSRKRRSTREDLESLLMKLITSKRQNGRNHRYLFDLDANPSEDPTYNLFATRKDKVRELKADLTNEEQFMKTPHYPDSDTAAVEIAMKAEMDDLNSNDYFMSSGWCDGTVDW